MLKAIEETLISRFSADGHATTAEHTYPVGDATARVRLQLNHKSQQVFRYWLGHNRVSREVLSTLSCTAQHCPRRQAMMQKWREHQTGVPTRQPKPSPSSTPCVLAHEEIIETTMGRFFAREAKFPSTVLCPESIHDPIKVSISGWDIFDDHGYVCGGLQEGTPMFESLSQVKDWIDAHVDSYASSHTTARTNAS